MENNQWSCKSCVFYPPSSTDGKPCCCCDSDADNPVFDFYTRKEELIMTNYNRIKAMSMEEMADMIDNIEDIACKPCSPTYCDGYSENGLCPADNKIKYCHAATVKWLESEATP